MGARGNSGVILSQLLRGMCERMGVAGEAGVDGAILADAPQPEAAAAFLNYMKGAAAGPVWQASGFVAP